MGPTRPADVGPPIGDQAVLFKQLLRQLGQRSSRHEKVLATLEAVRESLAVPLVVWLDAADDQPVLCSPLDADESAEAQPVLEAILGAHPEKVAAFSTHQVGHRPAIGELPVSSVAAVPVRAKGHLAWIFAVNPNPTRVLGMAELHLLDLAASILQKQLAQDAQAQAVKGSLIDIVRCLATIIDAKDPCTAGHSDRVSQIAARIGRAMGLPGGEINALRLAGLIHDIGKIGIRDGVLTKAGKLTEDELAHVQEHPVIGDGIIATIAYFTNLRPGVRSHHERVDGKGYPDGLHGNDIPLIARIMAVADSVDAMMSPRCYRKGMQPPHIDHILNKFAGTQWDRAVVEAFMSCRQDVYPPIYQRGIGESDTAMHAIADIVERLTDESSTHVRLALR